MSLLQCCILDWTINRCNGSRAQDWLDTWLREGTGHWEDDCVASNTILGDTSQVDTAPQASLSESSPQDSPPEYTPTPEAPSTTTEEAKPAQKGCPQDIFWWIPIYSIGASCCIAGLISLVVREIGQKRAIERITFVFGTFSATLVVLAILACFLGLLDKREDHGWDLFFILVISLLMMVVLTIGVIGPLYSDWILGALAGDFGGVPTPKAQTIYWLYFTSRLLPFLSF